MKKSHKMAMAGIIAGGILFVSYMGFSLFFIKHYYFNTTINGVDCSLKSAGQVSDRVKEKISPFTLTVTGREGQKESIVLNEVKITPEFTKSLEDMAEKQNNFLWPVSLWKASAYEQENIVEFSEEELEESMEGLGFFDKNNQKEPKDAFVQQTGDGIYEIVPEEKGTKPDKEKMTAMLREAVLLLEEEVNVEECYVEPSITEKDKNLNAMVSQLNQILSSVITYEFGTDMEIVDKNLIREWILLEGQQVTINEEEVGAYVRKLSKKYDTWGLDREFVTTDGETITITEGAYGWWMDRPEEKKALIEAIKKGSKETRIPIYRATAAQYGSKDYGDSYVEINLTKQHLYCYVDGQMVLESDFVSGNILKGNGTPGGIFGITYKERDATLQGETYSSKVSYWMPFNGNVGMHDASWRNQFGGDIFVTSGSHGCINLPKDKAAQIYEYVEKGTPVIVYGGVIPAPLMTPEQMQQSLSGMGILQQEQVNN